MAIYGNPIGSMTTVPKNLPALDSAIAEDVRRGLTTSPKSLPAWLFYDAAGSALFEQITDLPEYYLTRAERQILTDCATEIVSAAGTPVRLVELGAGTATKTHLVVAALLRRQLRLDYCPIDVSASALQLASDELHRAFPQVHVEPVVADYTNGVAHVLNGGTRRLVLYLGSSIGNFDPEDALDLLRHVRDSLKPGDALLLGTDLAKNSRILVPAYDDAAGVTAAFNKNVLVRINRELGADFDLDSFHHEARWNRERSRMEMHLVSRNPHTVFISALDLTISFDKNESIHTENSYKYTLPQIRKLAKSSRFALERTWTDANDWFALHLLRA
jgi:L-histidine Nalpha-methyltransferase